MLTIGDQNAVNLLRLFADCPVGRHVEMEQRHGRLESRTYYQITAPVCIHGRSEWKRVKTLAVAVRVYEQNGVHKIRYTLLRAQFAAYRQAIHQRRPEPLGHPSRR